MSLARKLCAFSALISMMANSTALADGYPNAVSCANGPGACIPKRMTFGYYPTSWRRWPTDQRGVATKGEPEPVPVPPAAKELPAPDSGTRPTPAPEKVAPPETTVPDQAPLLPAEPDEAKPEPMEPMELPLTPPMDDGPPEPPRNELPETVPEPAKPSPLDRLLEPSTPTEPMPDAANPSNLLPGARPFNEEPPFDKETPSEPAPAKGARSGPLLPRQEPQSAFRWHEARKGKATAQIEDRPDKVDTFEEPRRLPQLAAAAPLRSTTKARPESVAMAHGNPLRSGAVQPSSDRVVPTANWTVVEPVRDTPIEGLRSNPLRSP